MSKNRPVTIVIFGASGDLTKRKLIPALYEIANDQLLPEATRIVGFARSEHSHDDFRRELQEAIAESATSKPARDAERVKDFVASIYYQSGRYDDESSYDGLRRLIQQLDDERNVEGGQSNRLYYLATPPKVFFPIISALGRTGSVVKPGGGIWTRTIVEKPFGHDLESATALNRDILSVLNESQVYRIDHYLGKETVQNIMAFRFGNAIFEPLWNRRYIDNVQITVSESEGVGTRASYYDEAGALRDMVQNHILQLVSLIALEPPASFSPNAVHNEKVKTLNSLRPMSKEDVKRRTIRAQYAAGTVGGESIPAYLDEPGVAGKSRTETFVAMKLYIDNWRWAGVPFFVRTGKALAERITEITIEFRQPPLALFGRVRGREHTGENYIGPNALSIRVQPDEAIRLHFGLKVPGPEMILEATEMEFCYSDIFDTPPREAYERLLLDAILGDSTLFIRNDEVEAAWTFVDPILRGWAGDDAEIHTYPAGGWGPKAADELLTAEGRQWVKLPKYTCK